MLITTQHAHADTTGAAKPLPPPGPRQVRLFYDRQLFGPSLVQTPPARLQTVARPRGANKAAATGTTYPRLGAWTLRDLQALLLRPAVDRPASRFGEARAEFSTRFIMAAPASVAAPAQASPRIVATLAQPGGLTRAAAVAQPVTAAVPVLRNPDVRPDRNLDRLAPAAAQSPAAETYDQTGLTVGSFLYKPAVEILAGYNTNPGRQAAAAGSPVIIVAPELSIRSQFERHQLNADFRGAYTDDTAQRALSHPTAEARVDGRYDLTGSTRLTAEGRFLNDALITPGFVQQPRATTFGATAGVAQRFGPAEIAVKGSYDRILFSNAILGTNQILNTQDRNYQQPGAQMRVSYVLSPELTPFIDLSFDRRNHDLVTDFNGMQRDSTGLTGRGGVAISMGPVTGDVSFGYLSRRFDAPAMRNFGGWVADATLAWAADEATTLVLVARTQASETPAANIFGILSRDVILQADHKFEPWLTGTLRAGYGQDRFVGADRIDNRFFVAGGGVYKLSQYVHLKSDVRAEWTRSNVAMNNVLAVIGLVGVRLQY